MTDLETRVEIGERIGRLRQDPVVRAWVESRTRVLTDAMVQAAIADDQARRDAAVELQAMTQFLARLDEVIARGIEAAKQLERGNG
jgi:hypothetical protein